MLFCVGEVQGLMEGMGEDVPPSHPSSQVSAERSANALCHWSCWSFDTGEGRM